MAFTIILAGASSSHQMSIARSIHRWHTFSDWRTDHHNFFNSLGNEGSSPLLGPTLADIFCQTSVSLFRLMCVRISPRAPLRVSEKRKVGASTDDRRPGLADWSAPIPSILAPPGPRVDQRVDQKCPFTSNPEMANVLIVLDVSGDAMPVIGTQPIFWAPLFPKLPSSASCRRRPAGP